MTQKSRIFVLLLVLFTSLGHVPVFAGGKGKHKPKTTQKVRQAKQVAQDDGDYYNGHKVITGPRGGRYYINGNGNKTYIRK